MSAVSRRRAFPWCLPRSIHEVTYRKNGLIPKVLSPSFLNLTARVKRTGPLHSAYPEYAGRASSLKFRWNFMRKLKSYECSRYMRSRDIIWSIKNCIITLLIKCVMKEICFIAGNTNLLIYFILVRLWYDGSWNNNNKK